VALLTSGVIARAEPEKAGDMKNEQALAPFDYFYALYECYLAMESWKTPHFDELDEPARKEFQRLVESRELFAYVEDCKCDVIRHVSDVPDRWLHPICAGRITLDAGLSDAQRHMLAKIQTEMYPRLMRLMVVNRTDALPTLTPTDDIFAKIIDEKPGWTADAICAEACKSASMFYESMKRLKPHGYRNIPQRGYHGPGSGGVRPE
jgi:hypothetical protein